jgi:hypothetical protein
MDYALVEIDKVKNTTSHYNHCHSGAIYIAPKDSCILGDQRNARVALLGDSHAFVLADEIERYLLPRRIGFIPMTYGGCPPVRGLYRVDEKKDVLCDKFNDEVFEYLRMSPAIDIVVLVARWPLYLEGSRFDNGAGGSERGGSGRVDVMDGGIKQVNDESVRKMRVSERYASGINDLLAIGKKVVLVYPIPETGWSVPEFLKKTHRNQDGILMPLDGSVSKLAVESRTAHSNAIFDAIGEHANLYRVKPKESLCANERCIVHIGGAPLYFDDNHLSDLGAKQIIPDIFAPILMNAD